MHSRLFTSSLILLALTLAGCNGQEDFSDAIVAGNIIDGNKPNPNFDPDKACQSRVVGNLVDGGIVKNIGYECGGYRGYTGKKGIPSEVDQNRFVCPLYSTSVRFFLGGANDPREYLGAAHFRVAAPAAANTDDQGGNTCVYLDDTQEYAPGSVYDADGPYLFSVADLFDGPARVDVFDGAANEQVAQNVSALLTGLDGTSNDTVVLIDDEAHRLVRDSLVTFPDFAVPFSTFVDSAGLAKKYLDTIDANAGAVGTLPGPASVGEVVSRLKEANGQTAAGIYQFNMLLELYMAFYITDTSTPPIFSDEAIGGSLLALRLLEDGMIRADINVPESADLFIVNNLTEYLPYMLVDRSGRLFSGGAFNVGRYDAGSGPADPEELCEGEPLYLALATGAKLNNNLTFTGMTYEPVEARAGDMTVTGRFINGVAYSEMPIVDGDTIRTDYELDYGTGGRPFSETIDKSTIKSDLCGATRIDEQLIQSYRRQGLVMPALDRTVMENVFPDPVQYDLDYRRRLDADAEADTASAATAKITVHQDGTIMTDINDDGNVTLNADGIAAGEYVIGMVSSVYPGNADPATPGYYEDAQINIVVYNFGPKGSENDISNYGSHFRARLMPTTDCAAEALYQPVEGTPTEFSYWFGTYDITNWLRTASNPTPEQKYEAMRTKAYGVIKGKRSSACAP